MQNLNLNIEKLEGEKPATIFIGTANTPDKPKPVTFIGDIYAPIRFWEKRKAIYEGKEDSCHVEINKEALMVKLVTDETDVNLKNEITGMLKYFEDYLSFKINTKDQWDPMDLAQHCKMNKYLFDDESQNAVLVNALMNIKAKVKNEVEKADNLRGDKKILVDTVVNHNIPVGFILNMEVIKGVPKMKFHVEINVKHTDSSFFLNLISPDLKKTIDEYKFNVIAEIEKRFGDKIAILHL